jgi:hypothetical protein
MQPDRRSLRARRRIVPCVYAHAMRRDEGDKERLKALVEGRDWALLGTTRADPGSEIAGVGIAAHADIHTYRCTNDPTGPSSEPGLHPCLVGEHGVQQVA